MSGGGLGTASGVESGSGVASRRRVWRLVRQCPLWRLVASVETGGWFEELLIMYIMGCTVGA